VLQREHASGVREQLCVRLIALAVWACTRARREPATLGDLLVAETVDEPMDHL
jgi:hypothetical protein